MSDDRRESDAEVQEAPASAEAVDKALVFMKPGDNPELDALLEELKKDSVDGDPFNPDWSRIARARRSRAAGKAKAKAAAHSQASRKRLSPRWVSVLMFTIAAPVVAMTIGLLLRRGPANPGDAGAKGEATRTEAATGTDAGADTGAGADTATGADTGAGTGTDMGTATATDTGTDTATGADTGALRAARSRSSASALQRPKLGAPAGPREEDPYEPRPAGAAKPAVTVTPAAPTAAPTAAPPAPGSDIW